MATDIQAIIDNLVAFYDFTGRRVIHVGAGNGQLIGYAPRARSVLGVDCDAVAVARLRIDVEEMNLQDRFTVTHGDFLSVSQQADVVFFEFCLHEMSGHDQVLAHARSLAPEIVVLDHLPDSRWAWHTCETEKAECSWEALRSMVVTREASFGATQWFADHAELHERVAPLGPAAVERAAALAGRSNIEIEMTYAAALVSRGALDEVQVVQDRH